jgi:FAD/FMN-containing dehydrogenase
VTSGFLLHPRDDGYDAGRRIWNGMHDRHPAVVARCRTAGDVRAAVRYAASHGLGVTVRGGGHNVAGAAVADGALMIDLSLLRDVVVDAGARRADAAGGCLLRDLDAATAPHGLACPAGVVSHTGLGGLALGGGYGWLARKWGLTCDHILGAQVVLGTGEIVEASPDLLWALRGGGGNFGVVTRFTLRLRPVAPMYYRTAVFGLAQAEAALSSYRRFAPKQSNDLHAVGALKIAGDQPWIPAELHGRPVLALTALFTGDPADGPEAVAGLFDPVPAAASRERVISFAELQALGDFSEPPGHRYFTKSGYLSDVSGDTAIELLKSSRGMLSPLSSIDFEYLRGAIAEPTLEDSAFPRRAAPYMCTFSAHWTDPAQDGPNIQWARDSLDRTSRDHCGGSYLNYVQDEPVGGAPEIYGTAAYRRLAEVKRRYDPANVFRHGVNIAPASRPSTERDRFPW